MKPLQPILDVLEKAEHPRARAIEVSNMKPIEKKSTQPLIDPFQFEMMRRQAQLQQQMNNSIGQQQQAMGLNQAFGQGGFIR